MGFNSAFKGLNRKKIQMPEFSKFLTLQRTVFNNSEIVNV